MRILVTGGRDYSDDRAVWSVLTTAHVTLGDAPKLIVGDCPTGLDEAAFRLAGELGWLRSLHHAEWDEHGKAAGPLRNQRMIDSEPDCCIAFPGGRGTADCIRRANAAGIPILIIDDESTHAVVMDFFMEIMEAKGMTTIVDKEGFVDEPWKADAD